MNLPVEERLRVALHARAEASDVVVPRRFVPTSPPRRRRPMALTVAGVAVAASVLAGVVIARQPDPPLATEMHVSGPESTIISPVPPDSPLPRVILDVPGLRPVHVEERLPTASQENVSGPGIDGFHMQSFRTPKGLEGPLVWVLSMPPPPSTRNDYGFGVGRAVTVQGTTGWLQSGTSVGYRLAWPGADGGGVILTSVGLSEAELLGVAGGLRPRAAGWDATVLPYGLAPHVDSPRRGVAGARSMDADYSGPNVAGHVSVAAAAPTSFDDRAMGVGIAPSVETVAIAGETGLLVQEPGRPNSWVVIWQPTPTTMAEVRLTGSGQSSMPESMVRDWLLGVRVVSESEWLSTLPDRTVRPTSVPGEVMALQEGIPLPQGVTWDELRVQAVARDRQSLADQVMSWAACAWHAEWRNATDAGDRDRADAAIDAVDASGTWPAAAVASGDQSAAAASRAVALAEQMRSGAGIRMCA